MADRTITERLQPSLLDRLTDDQRDAATEERDDWLIDMRRLRDIVLRDLSWLINTTNSGLDLEAFPQAAKSVLNYGIDSISGMTAGGQRALVLRQSLLNAIETYEPRLRSGTLDLRLAPGEGDRGDQLIFDIRADLWAQPLPMELYLRTKVDMSSGEASVTRSG